MTKKHEPSVGEYFLGSDAFYIGCGLFTAITIIPLGVIAYPEGSIIIFAGIAALAVTYLLVKRFLFPSLLRLWRKIKSYRLPVKVTVVVEHKNT